MLLRRFALVAVALSLLPLVQNISRAAEHSVAQLAHIKLSGDLDETPVSAEPLFGPPSENFKSKLDRIKKAKNDAAIDGLYLQIEGDRKSTRLNSSHRH